MVHAYDSTKLSLDEAIVLLILVTHRKIEVKYLKSSNRKELNTMCVRIFIQFRCSYRNQDVGVLHNNRLTHTRISSDVRHNLITLLLLLCMQPRLASFFPCMYKITEYYYCCRDKYCVKKHQHTNTLEIIM
jgi:hypothetical protein